MNRSRRAAAASLAAAAGVLLATAVDAGAYDRPGVTERVSVASSGAQANDNSSTETAHQIAMTPDGRYVAFPSSATNLVAGYGNAAGEVYVRDRKARTTRIASSGCTIAGEPSISDNGRYVAFSGQCKLSTDLVAIPQQDVYVHDFVTGTTTRVSVAPDAARATLTSASYEPVLSGDGHVVAFVSTASNLVSQPTCATSIASCFQANVYARDLRTKVTTLVSATSSGTVGNGASNTPSISRDGRYVAFSSAAGNLSTDDVNACTAATPSCPDVYLRDLKTGAVELVSVGLDGMTGPGESGGNDVAIPDGISDDGRYVAFRSNTSGLVPNTPVSYTGIYVRDRKLHRTERVSVDSDGAPVSLGDGVMALDGSGRFVAFDDVESALPGCGGPKQSAAVHDRLTGATVPLLACGSVADAGYPQMSSGGRFVAFVSDAAAVVPGDTNRKRDVFVRDRGQAAGVGDVRGSVLLGARPGFVDVADAAGDVTVSETALGLDVVSATVAYRPVTADLFVRLAVDRMPLYAIASPAVVYAVDFTAGSSRYELRAGKGVTGPSFELFRATAGRWTHVADLRGGYGTTGEEVVAAVPLDAVDAGRGGTLRDVSAAAGFGAVATGVVDPVDVLGAGKALQ